MTDPTVAVLDIDGTLIDSNYQHALAWYRALRSVGETYPVWRLHRLIGMGGDQVVTAVGGEDLERRAGDQARERQGKEVDALVGEMAPLPGARDLLVAIKERGHRLALASSAQQRHVNVFLDKLDALVRRKLAERGMRPYYAFRQTGAKRRTADRLRTPRSKGRIIDDRA